MGDLQLYFHLGAYKLGPFRTFPERSVSELCELPVDWRRLVEKVPPSRPKTDGTVDLIHPESLEIIMCIHFCPY